MSVDSTLTFAHVCRRSLTVVHGRSGRFHVFARPKNAKTPMFTGLNRTFRPFPARGCVDVGADMFRVFLCPIYLSIYFLYIIIIYILYRIITHRHQLRTLDRPGSDMLYSHSVRRMQAAECCNLLILKDLAAFRAFPRT